MHYFSTLFGKQLYRFTVHHQDGTGSILISLSDSQHNQ